MRRNEKLFFNNEISSSGLIIFVSIFLITFDNQAFFANVTNVYPIELKNLGFLISLVWGFTGAIIILLSLLCYKYTLKPIIIAVLVISSFASYFMDSYNTIINDDMINNIIHTDINESLDLLTGKLVLYVVLLGVFPSFLVYKTNVSSKTSWQAFISKIALCGLTFLSLLGVVFIFSDFYSSFFREHKPLRYYANPSYYMFSSAKYVTDVFKANELTLTHIGLDAKQQPGVSKQRKLVIMVVGETARADHFSLNGYVKETNPLLKKQHIISFSDFWSCGTSTAVSVPCLFSNYTESNYDKKKYWRLKMY